MMNDMYIWVNSMDLWFSSSELNRWNESMNE